MSRSVGLDQRLLLVAGQVRPNAVFADVGCDHGRLAVYLVQQRQARAGFACDIRPQPLEKARQLVEKTGLSSKITIVLTNGLQGLESKGITDVTIAGIGGEVIGDIIEKASFLQKPGVRLVLQPMSREHLLRQALYRLGFFIVEEQAVHAKKFVYTVITAEYGGTVEEISPLFAYTGLLPRQNTEESRCKLERTAAMAAQAGKGLLAQGKRAAGQELLDLAAQIKRLAGQEALAEGE